MTSTITHDELVLLGAKWLNKKAPNVFYKCQFVCTELSCSGTLEIPDILGLRPHGNVLIEVKVSRADFKRDRLKKGRSDEYLQLGFRRLYLAPKGMLKVGELPEGWGLIEWNGKDIKLTEHSDTFEEDKQAIRHIYHSILRRTTKPQVFNFET